MAHSNALIAALSPDDAAALRPHLKNVELKEKHVLFEVGDTIRAVLLPGQHRGFAHRGPVYGGND